MTEPSGVLQRIDSACQFLAECRDLKEIKDLRDKAEAMRMYASAAKKGLEAQNHAAEIKLRAERRAGEILSEQGRAVGQRNQISHPAISGIPKLTEIGITPTQASRWKSEAAVPEPVFEQHVADVRAKGAELTTAAVVEIGRKVKAEERAVTRQAAEEARPEPDQLPVTIEVRDAADMPLSSNVVDLIVTSPPYGLDKKYGDDVQDKAAEWRLFMDDWLVEAYRVAKDGGRLALNIPLDTTKPYPRSTFADAIFAAEEAGWTYRWTIVWNEGNISRSVARGSVDSASSPHVITPVEMIAVFHKGEWARAAGKSDINHDDWLAWTNGLWTFTGEGRAWEGHPAAFPIELPTRLIRLLSYRGDCVLDPFVGSGTTMVAAYREGREGIGFDLSKKHVASAKRRLALEVKGVPK